eukprot:TRINITY_DN2562_c0_g1_i1.p1 TRINITY_DN2562_c0_g1~~TRINITY_DN2562_c0_g1_i1.p1  ORF type:complete len:2836 (-),score=859.97 TRINITY_DN2562_c0_g1_i1:92-8599(-)
MSVNTIRYPAADGSELLFDISDESCSVFSFTHGQVVLTPLGRAKVIGIRDGNLWFHVEGQRGASYWGMYSPERYEEDGFVVLTGEDAESFDPFIDPSKPSETEAPLPESGEPPAQTTEEKSPEVSEKPQSVDSFDESPEKCGEFGFLSKASVTTPMGAAIVLGVREDDLWFKPVGDDEGKPFCFHGVKGIEAFKEKSVMQAADAVEHTPLPEQKEEEVDEDSVAFAMSRTGERLQFDISRDQCKAFGFMHGERVQTDRGHATVVGVRDGKLWFNVDGDGGASFWSGFKSRADFERAGFRILSSDTGSDSGLKKFGMPTPPIEAISQERVYQLKSGEMRAFNVKEDECAAYGFLAGDLVETPRGPATVIGILDGNLWFHIEGDLGASYWSGYKSKEFFESHGFKLVASPGIEEKEVVEETPEPEVPEVPPPPVPYMAPVPSEPSSDVVAEMKTLKARSGDLLEFDVKEENFVPFGFSLGERVQTPRGPATVSGIREGNVWFLVDGDEGVSYWSGLTTPSQFTAQGFRSLTIPIEVEPVKPPVVEHPPPYVRPTPFPDVPQHVTQSSPIAESTSSKIMYPMRIGGEVEFDISREACESFGFLHNGRVLTSAGPATVVGVRDGELWFHIDGQPGASFWGGAKTVQDFEEKGVSRLESVMAKARSGDVWEFNTSDSECMSFGFKHGARVATPKGHASVIGVREDHLWFHIDGDTGASFFSHKSPADFEGAGFRLLVGDPVVPFESAPVQDASSALKRRYPLRAGGEEEFDTSPEVCTKFGFPSGVRVNTPRGPASVVGVFDGKLWFHVDGDSGASYWSMTTPDEFQARGFTLAGPASETVGVPSLPQFPGESSSSEPHVVRMTRDGKSVLLDISATACGSFGFAPNQRFSSPLGAGTVVGVAHGRLWVVLDGENGVSYWTHKTVEEFRVNGVVPLDDVIQHPLRDGTMSRFKTSLAACSPFGFYHGQRVQTTKGPAKVVGVSESDGKLYFHVDGDSGASYWNIMEKEEFARRGFTLLSLPRLASSLAAVPPMAIPEVPPPSLMEELEAGKSPLDISNATIRMFAVYHDQPVYTPSGFARVAGIREGVLHFRLSFSGKYVNFGSCGDEIVTKIHVYPLEEAGVSSIFFQSGEDKSKMVVETDPSVCAPFGYKHGERVSTPNGEAHVVGVSSGDMWFYIPCSEGAIRWGGFHAAEFVSSGFRSMETAATIVSSPSVLSAVPAPSMVAPIVPVMIKYPARAGNLLAFDIGESVVSSFGVVPGTVVQSPRGPAHVIGLFDGNLWFHVHGEPGASYWPGLKKENVVAFPVLQSGLPPPVSFKTRMGEDKEFAIDFRSIAPFGFFHGQRVTTPKGSATVVGVADGELWFMVDGDSGASFWAHHGHDEFLRDGFLIEVQSTTSVRCPLSSGEMGEFNISQEKLAPFGFAFADRVVTSKGMANVVGEKDGNLWFRVWDDSGASCWEGWSKEDFVKNGFKAVHEGPDFVSIPGSDGAMLSIDSSFVACELFGLLPSQMVRTPNGGAIVLGVAGGNVLFKLTSSTTVTKFDGCKTKSDFAQRGVSPEKKVVGKTLTGQEMIFDISRSVVEKFGFSVGSRVETPKGAATVVGCAEGNLWFHVDGDDGMCFWSSCKKREDFYQKKFTLIHKPIWKDEKDLDGKVRTVDVSRDGLAFYGFVGGESVSTPRGRGKVVGVSDKQVWFSVEGYDGICCFTQCIRKEDFEARGFVKTDQFRTITGDLISLDTSPKACEMFGFRPMERVVTPRGPAWVVGVQSARVWFHCDVDSGVVYWGSCRTKSDYVQRGFAHLHSSPPTQLLHKQGVLNGPIELFDISLHATIPFGFVHGQRIKAPKGLATVIGAHAGRMWFQFDPEDVASPLMTCEKKDDYISKGVHPLSDPDGVSVMISAPVRDKEVVLDVYSKSSTGFASHGVRVRVSDEKCGMFLGRGDEEERVDYVLWDDTKSIEAVELTTAEPIEEVDEIIRRSLVSLYKTSDGESIHVETRNSSCLDFSLFPGDVVLCEGRKAIVIGAYKKEIVIQFESDEHVVIVDDPETLTLVEEDEHLTEGVARDMKESERLDDEHSSPSMATLLPTLSGQVLSFDIDDSILSESGLSRSSGYVSSHGVVHPCMTAYGHIWIRRRGDEGVCFFRDLSEKPGWEECEWKDRVDVSEPDQDPLSLERFGLRTGDFVEWKDSLLKVIGVKNGLLLFEDAKGNVKSWGSMQSKWDVARFLFKKTDVSSFPPESVPASHETEAESESGDVAPRVPKTSSVLPPMSSGSKVVVKAKSGREFEVDTAIGACASFGFLPGQHVETPFGPGKVVGVEGGELWFNLEKEDGVVMWSGAHSLEEFVDLGVKLDCNHPGYVKHTFQRFVGEGHVPVVVLTTPEICRALGFTAGTYVYTSDGPAVVAGVSDRMMWFHNLESQKLKQYGMDHISEEDWESVGVRVMDDEDVSVLLTSRVCDEMKHEEEMKRIREMKEKKEKAMFEAKKAGDSEESDEGKGKEEVEDRQEEKESVVFHDKEEEVEEKPSEKVEIVRKTAIDGTVREFSTNAEECARFGFLPGVRVNTPRGLATTVGVDEGRLWFHVDGESGPRFWLSCQTHEDFVRDGFTIVSEEGDEESSGVVDDDDDEFGIESSSLESEHGEDEEGISVLSAAGVVSPVDESFLLEYSTFSGGRIKFDTSDDACKRFGFRHGQRVTTPRGASTVIGVHNRQLYFHCDGDPGATFWSDLKKWGDFEACGFRILDDVARRMIVEEYPDVEGKFLQFDVSDAACSLYGFLHGQRVVTPKGLADVVGVRGGTIWFHCDCDRGATFWSELRKMEDFLRAGFHAADETESRIEFFDDDDDGDD